MPTAIPVRAIGQRLGKAAGKTTGSFDRPSNSAKIDRVLFDAVEQKPRNIGHPRFGVTIGGGVIAVDIAEIALAVDQRITRGKILREADKRVIDRLVAVRMESTHHVADDLCGFLGGEPGSSRKICMP